MRTEELAEIEVVVDADLAVLRYRSAIEISENGQEPGKLEAWHLDAYRRNARGDWQIQWSQATAVR
jgi:ketosteroid isomerase-like protein